jgi:Zn-finger nucleic acid-binding protein
MKCPIDNRDLVMTERQGIEIDYCPTCRGVWLDRGELDKIIERSAGQEPEARGAPDTRYETEGDRRDYDDRYGRRDRKHGRRRGSLLGDLFDFD